MVDSAQCLGSAHSCEIFLTGFLLIVTVESAVCLKNVHSCVCTLYLPPLLYFKSCSLGGLSYFSQKYVFAQFADVETWSDTICCQVPTAQFRPPISPQQLEPFSKAAVVLICTDSRTPVAMQEIGPSTPRQKVAWNPNVNFFEDLFFSWSVQL